MTAIYVNFGKSSAVIPSDSFRDLFRKVPYPDERTAGRSEGREAARGISPLIAGSEKAKKKETAPSPRRTFRGELHKRKPTK